MSETVLKIENLSKLYRLGEVGTGTISHDLNRWFAKVRGKEDPFAKVGQVNDRSQKSTSDYIWALKGVDIEVKKGEVLGIIGKNGAGKSTLLKLISQITAPTAGSIKAKGRVASLLEVGTGMHPEMTAKENIYLNGAILGMTKKEIRSKFDEILDFAGCKMYVDTPIKRFSSGMTVRLAFAVAAFLEPEILIVDEVLAVGDAEFQSKAIGKMKDVSSTRGRTVLFVSHNMASVRNLCSSAIVLEYGQTVFSGSTDEAISYYLQSEDRSKVTLRNREDRLGSAELKFVDIDIINSNKEKVSEVFAGESIRIDLHYEINKAFDLEEFLLSIVIFDNEEKIMAAFPSDELGTKFNIDFNESEGIISLNIDEFLFRPNEYYLSIYSFLNGSGADNYVDMVKNAKVFKVINNDFFHAGNLIRNGNYTLLKGNYT